MISGWITDEIDNLCNVEYGTRVVQKNDGGTTYPVYGGGGATFAMDTFNREDRLTIARFAMSAKCTRFVKGKFFLNDSGLTLSPKDNSKIEQNFLNYQCLALNDVFYSLAKGSAQKNLNVPAFRKLKLNIPIDIKIQKKIVAKLDAIFAEIDKATAAAEANAKNAEALFSQVLNKLDEEYEGTITELGSCVELLSGFAFKSNEYTNNDTDIPLLRGDNLNPQRIDFSEAKRLDKCKYDEFIKYSLNIKDIVLGMDRPLISSGLRIAQVQASNLPSLLVQRVMRMRCKKHVDSDFLFFLLNSPKFINHLVGEQTGLGVPHISAKTISSFTVNLPKLEHQHSIVSKLSSIVSQLNRYKLANKKILSRWSSYKQAILKQAFNGELVKE